MNRSIKQTFVGLILVAAVGSAQAGYIPTTWTQDYTVAQDVSASDPFHYTHNLALSGFTLGADIVTDFVLTIDLVDDARDGFLSAELAFVDLPGLLGDRLVSTFDFGTGAYAGSSIQGLLNLNVLGTLSFDISAILGDFRFAGSHLVANGFALRDVTAVPEPGSLALLSLGLLGMVAGVRGSKAAR